MGSSDARGCGLRGLSGSSVDPPQDVSLKTRFQMMAKDYGKVIVVSKALSRCFLAAVIKCIVCTCLHS